MSMKERDREKFLARQTEQAAARKAAQPQKRTRRRGQHASRQEQYGRYLDCGPLAWDDRAGGP